MEATSRYAKALRATVERDPRSGGCRGAASFNRGCVNRFTWRGRWGGVSAGTGSQTHHSGRRGHGRASEGERGSC